MTAIACRAACTATLFRRASLAFVALALAGCATTRNVQQIEVLETRAGTPKVLLMPPDIRYYLVTAGGVAEPHAEWTEAARENFSSAMEEYAGRIGADLHVLDDNDLTPAELQYAKLHEAVGYAALAHHFGQTKLPSKNGRFDWSLGPGVSEIGEEYGADYALFVFYRDEQASGGRVAFAILAAATGAYVPAGNEYGFASLVDLETGDIVWFNMVGAGNGELRDAGGAATAVETLFKDMPARPSM